MEEEEVETEENEDDQLISINIMTDCNQNNAREIKSRCK